MPRILQIISHSEDETYAMAKKLAGRIEKGQLIVLSGELGSGKTAFVKGLAAGLGLNKDDVSSPSYTIVNEYPGQIPLFHFDLYRLGSPSELTEVGWEDYLGREGIAVAEWGEKAEYLLPRNYMVISFEMVSDSERQITIEVIKND